MTNRKPQPRYTNPTAAVPPMAMAASVPGGTGRSAANRPRARHGIPVLHLKRISSRHPTEGLRHYPAHDYFAPAHSKVVAPVRGHVIKLSGTDPSLGPAGGVHGPFGWSLYIRGHNGKTYYLTHLGGRRVHVGEHVHQGQVIGRVGNYAKWGGMNHIHMGVHG